ncbi:sugar ABC transporter permease [Frankia sp. Cr1]|uniref:carbohydrate ABC transporter permease n=1 Tax=Frankia sp. Cr1 TaxID=3073931 RepID=UPI002AD210FB|nr:sugar ABC transporter permease [Frankia sp. Cr1]
MATATPAPAPSGDITAPAARAAPAHKGKRRPPRPVKEWLTAYGFIAPSFLGVLAFLLLPVIAVFVLSLFKWNLLGDPSFVGLDNFSRMVRDEEVRHSLLITFEYVLLNIPLQTVLALLLALFLNRKLRGIKVFRVLFVLPWMATPIAMAIIWQWIFDPARGSLNGFLNLFGIPGQPWLSSETWALLAVAAVNIWQYTGYNALFFLAGLQNIPDYLDEAARLDGAGPVRQFFSITLPLLRPTLFFVLVTSVIGSFQVFDTVYAMTKGGPGEATNVLNYEIYNRAFKFFDAGYASTIALLLFAVIVAITALQSWYFHNRTVYDLS